MTKDKQPEEKSADVKEETDIVRNENAAETPHVQEPAKATPEEKLARNKQALGLGLAIIIICAMAAVFFRFLQQDDSMFQLAIVLIVVFAVFSAVVGIMVLFQSRKLKKQRSKDE